METSVQCPRCFRNFRIPDHVMGKRIGCPGCKTAFVAQNEGIQPFVRHPPDRILDARPAPDVAEEESFLRRNREDEAPPGELRKRSRRRKNFGIPVYLWALALLPWGIPMLTLGGCIWGAFGGGISALCFGIARVTHLSAAVRLLMIVALNALAYTVFLGVAVLALAWPSLTQPKQPAANPAAANNVAPPAPMAGPVAPPQAEEVLPPVQKIFEHGPRVYLAGLQEFGVQPGPWPFGRRGTGADGRTVIEVESFRSPNGLGMHPPGNGATVVKYRLGKQAAVFRALAALNDTSTADTSAALFDVLGDGKSLWRSRPITRAGKPQECSVSIADVDVLELQVAVQGSYIGVHAVWIEPRLLQKADTPDPSWIKKIFEDGPRTYVADLAPFDVKAGPWPFRHNGDIGDGHAIQVNNEPSPHGLGMHPPDKGSFAAARFHLDKKAALLKAQVALDDSSTIVWSQAGFEVWGDGIRLWQSPPIGKAHQPPTICEVDLTGVDVLELRVQSEGSHIGLHAVWIEPRVLQNRDTPDR
jgi:hypothetical protein